MYSCYQILTSGIVAAVMLSAPRVSIRATQVVMSGGTILVTCKVPRNVNNRTLRFGVDGYSTSTKQLDGDQARVTWQMFVEHMPCDIGPAFCEVVTAGGRVDRVELPVTVAACGMKRTD